MKKNLNYYGLNKPFSNFYKLLFTIKITILLLFCGMLNVLAGPSYSLATKISLNLKNSSTEEVLDKIEEGSEFYFLYNQKLVDVTRKVDIVAENKTIKDIFDDIFDGNDVKYTVFDRQIMLTNKQEYNSIDELQQQKVTGKVTDLATGEPLPGVNIYVLKSNIGAITDVNGNYSLDLTNPDVTLEFSFIGYIKQSVPVQGRTVIDVQLAASEEILDEVVVIGYGSVKKRDLTGSVSSIKSEDLILGSISSVDQALRGRVAGVQITQTSSEPGGGLSIRVRGASSINAGNEPLYVIDGLPIDNTPMFSLEGPGIGGNDNPKNPLNSLNPNDIKSIEILKDASATAIYGSRGANGVLLITTKKGIKGNVNMHYDFYTGVQMLAKKVDVLTTREYIDALNAISLDKGQSPIFSVDDIAAIGNGTDWQDEIFRTAGIQNHNLSFEGKVQKTSYYISANYFDQQGIVKKTGMKKYIFRFNLEQEIFDRLTLSVNINNSFVNDNVGASNNSTGDNQQGGSISSAIQYDPTLQIKNEDGTYVMSNDLLLNNPVGVVYGISNKIKTNRVFGNLMLNYKITDELSTKINLGTDQQMGRKDVYNSRATMTGKASNGLAEISSLENSNILAEYTLSYLKKINENHALEAVAGITYEDFIRRSSNSYVIDFPTDILGTDNLAFGNPSTAQVYSNKIRHTLFSYFGRVNLSLFDEFMLTGSIRADGSSRFGKNNKFGYFPSCAFAWKLTKLSFIPELFNELKFRTSWGITGNQEISNYASLATYSISGLAIFNGIVYNGASPSRVANPDLKWESTEQFNVGIDAGILNGRITGTFDYFIKNTKDMLINLPLPLSSGFSSILTNIGKMRDQGIEILLNLGIIVGKNFNWNTSLVFSSVKNKVISIGDLPSILIGGIVRVPNSCIIKPGLPLCSYYGYRITGIFQTADEVANSAQPTSKPGFPIFEDVNNDGKITTLDQVVLGDPFPDFTFGIGNTFSYKKFGLDVFFQGQCGNELLNANAIESMTGGQLKIQMQNGRPQPTLPYTVNQE
jgi:TonB-linked SusC/RagA family outer membrane protein